MLTMLFKTNILLIVLSFSYLRATDEEGLKAVIADADLSIVLSNILNEILPAVAD